MEIIRIAILGNNSNPLNLQTDTAVKPTKNKYPPPNAKAIGIFNMS